MDPALITFLYYTNFVFLVFFTFEMVSKLIGLGFSSKNGYFSDGWNNFDMVVVTISLIEVKAVVQQASFYPSLKGPSFVLDSTPGFKF